MGILSIRRKLASVLGPLVTVATLGRVQVDTSGEVGGEDLLAEKRGAATRLADGEGAVAAADTHGDASEEAAAASPRT